MVIVEIIGGLGNQMFQYAAGWALARRNGTQLKLDISGFANYPLHQGFEIGKVFLAQADIASSDDVKAILGWQSGSLVKRALKHPLVAPLRKSTLQVEPHFHYSEPHFQKGADTYLCGYWQSEKYFLSYAPEIRLQFQFKQPLNAENQRWADMVMNKNSVSIHIRRGDFITKKNVVIHGPCSIEYFTAAINMVRGLMSDAEFFIFSDDVPWAKENFNINSPIYFIENNTGAGSFNDMRLMGLCKHNIIANSSFSWWAAWLNENLGKIVVAPKKWFASGLDTPDLLPKSWVVL